MAITRRTLRLQQDVEDQLTRVTDKQARDLVAAWVTAWDEVAPDLTATLVDMLLAGDKVTRTQLLRSTRLQKALALTGDRLDTLAADAGVRITSDLQAVIHNAGGAQASVIDSQLPRGATELVDLDAWSKIGERQITAIVERSRQQITSLTKPLSSKAYDAVRRELIRGVAAGANPRETARRMVTRAEGRFNGGLTQEGAVVELDANGIPRRKETEPTAPTRSDNKPAWVDYAVAQGADPAEAEGMTKADLIEKYGS